MVGRRKVGAKGLQGGNMTSQVVRNDYLVRLLALQQDGASISAPGVNQRHCEILTEIDDIVKLGDSLLSNGHNNLARWHFL